MELGYGIVVACVALSLTACQDPNAGGAGGRHAKKGHGDKSGPTSIPPRPATVSVAAVRTAANTHFAPLPAVFADPRNPLTPEKVELGRMLYFDKRLSKNHDLSCATCHDLAGFGVDIREDNGKRAATSSGHRGQKGDRNTPTVYNAGLFVAQFWDGRSQTLEAQAKGPVTNPVEMAMADEEAVVSTLGSIPGYVEAFSKAFPEQEFDPVTYDNMAMAIGAFERQLSTPAPFDAFLQGDLAALTEQQVRGLDLFIKVDCVQCHKGPALGGTSFQKLGSVKPWEHELEDKGVAEVTKADADKFVFKVPTLRNITETGPYLHDGSIESLPQMVQEMAEHQLAKGEFEPDELDAVVAFLGSLKGTLPTDYIAEPELPPSGPATPPPDPS